MADSETFFVIGCIGTKKVKIFINKDAPLADFCLKVEEKLGIKQNSQKIIYKGKLLNDFEASMKSLGVKKGDCVMILGKVVKTDKDNILEELGKLEKRYKEEEKAVAAILRESKNQKGENLKEAMKKLLFANEKLMKLLESLDGVEVKVCDEIRAKRKSIVQNVQKLMDRVDKEYGQLETIVSTMS